MRMAMLSLACVVMLAKGCGAAPLGVSPGDPMVKEVTRVMPHRIPKDGRCGALKMLGTQTEITQSPRADRAAERLALRTVDSLVAPEERYQRILSDLNAIRASIPSLSDADVFSSFGTRAVFLELTPEVTKAVAKGTYRGFDCLHAWYGAARVKALTSVDRVIVYFRALYHPKRIRAAYGAHPDVLGTESNRAFGGGDDILLCSASFGGAHRYIFQRGWGDCLAGCLNYAYLGFEVSEEGDVRRLEPSEIDDACIATSKG